MIDIHSHIIFDVDDGPEDLAATQALLEESYRQGVRTIIATSHRRKGMFETPEEKIATHFEKVQALAREVASDLSLHYGAEIYFTGDVLEKLEQGRLPKLAGTRYVLVEFSMGTPYRDINKALNSLLMSGMTPVVAHIERYHCLENAADKVRELINMGCYMQINSASVLKPKLFGDKYKFMKQRAQYFLDKGLVHFVASDMHNLAERRPYMAEAYEIITKKYGQDVAQTLFVKNQQLLLENKEI